MLQNDYSLRLTHPSPHIATIFVCAMRAFKIHSFSNFQMFSASLVAQLVKNLPAMLRPGFDPWVGKIPWRRARLSTPVFWPGEFHRLYTVHGVTKSQTGLNDFHFHFLSNVQFSVVNYAVHCIPRSYSSENWKFVRFLSYLHPFPVPTPIFANHQSALYF